MTVTEEPTQEQDRQQLSLGTAAARNLATTTKTTPQMQEITSRWLLRVLPWVQVSGGAYRVNRRLSYVIGDGRLSFTTTNGVVVGDGRVTFNGSASAQVRVIPAELCELPVLHGFDDMAVLDELADRFTQQEYTPGQVIAEFGHQVDRVHLIAHGKVNKVGEGPYGGLSILDVLADGEFFGDQALTEPDSIWEFSVKAVTPCTILTIEPSVFHELAERSDRLRDTVAQYRLSKDQPANKHGEAAIALSSGHVGEPELPGTFVDYETSPREYELSVAQTVLRIHSRVADLYNNPMNQIEQQLRLTVEALRERQEHELVNNREFGLLHNADLKQRIHARTGPPTPDDLDELLSRRRSTHVLLAHPQAIAAIGRECSKRGLYPQSLPFHDQTVPSWRGVPLLPCSKIPITPARTTSVIAMRLGENDQGVVGLHQTGLPDEYQPGLNVRFMGISEKAIISYLVSAYYSAAVLVPDALGVLENVEIGHFYDA